MSVSKDESPRDNWKAYGIVCAACGLWIGIRSLLESDTFAIVGLLFLICGIGFWFRQHWARWAGIGICVTTAVLYATMRFLDHTFDLMTLLFMGASVYGAWRIWTDCPTTSTPHKSKEKKPMVSLVLLLRQPRYLEAPILAESISSAWGEKYSGGSADKDAERWVVGETPLFMINAPEGIYSINNFGRLYFDNMKSALDHVKELRLCKAVSEHQAWLSVDLMILHDKSAARDSVYPKIARLIAELAGPDCVALFQPETGRISAWDEALEAKLRGPNYLQVFSAPIKAPVVRVDDDDPRMKAAVEEARARWPEFVEAFKKKAGEDFSIKAPIAANDRQEFIWIHVAGLEPEYIHGTLGNDPVDLGELKLGDRVEVPLKDLNDWCFLRDGEPVGMFTVKILSDSQKQGA